jgi:ABC-type sulfate transport system permease subunit
MSLHLNRFRQNTIHGFFGSNRFGAVIPVSSTLTPKTSVMKLSIQYNDNSINSSVNTDNSFVTAIIDVAIEMIIHAR